jgi:hypothetical protein
MSDFKPALKDGPVQIRKKSKQFLGILCRKDTGGLSKLTDNPSENYYLSFPE